MRLIISADWHLRKDLPRCRLDVDWVGIQFKIVEFIINQTIQKGAGLCIGGDLFHQSIVQEDIKNKLITLFQPISDKIFVIIPGQHDMPYHSYNNLERSSFGIITKIFPGEFNKGEYHNVQASPFDMDKIAPFYKPKASIVFTHQLTFKTDKDRPFPGVGKTAEELLTEFPNAKWIFTGDNHKHFHYEKDSRHVINPGCITRQAVDFIDYQPVVYFVDTEKGEVDIIELPETEAMITDKYIQEETARDERIESFVSALKKQGNVSLNFRDNLVQRMGSKEFDKEIKDMVTELLEEVNQTGGFNCL